MVHRHLESILQSQMADNKAIVLLGARQTGKTTLIEFLFERLDHVLWMNGDDIETRGIFEDITLNRLKNIIGDSKYLVIDEAQRIKDIGIKLKLVTDRIKSVKLIVTGSSTLDIANEINEPLTGRKWEYTLYPFSFLEMVDHHGFLKENQLLEQRLIYGYYPEVVNSKKNQEEVIRNLANDYLYKDILVWGRIKKSEKILILLRAIAFQIGSEVSYNELSRIVGLDKETIEKYLDLLEKSFVIFKLSSFRRNLRSELKKSKKYYFFDNGIRNALIANFSPINLRNDIGALWENFILSERIKYTSYSKIYSNRYFWRTKSQQEIDYIEEREGKLHAYEIKWNKNSKVKASKTFLNAYPDSMLQIVHPNNFETFLGVPTDDTMDETQE